MLSIIIFWILILQAADGFFSRSLATPAFAESMFYSVSARHEHKRTFGDKVPNRVAEWWAGSRSYRDYQEQFQVLQHSC
jgi:hypothetical protein